MMVFSKVGHWYFKVGHCLTMPPLSYGPACYMLIPMFFVKNILLRF